MLETICKKLNVNSIEEYLQKRDAFFEKYKGLEIEYSSPLLALSFEELDFFKDYVDRLTKQKVTA